MQVSELHPTNGRRSFYGKALVLTHDNGTKELQSYTTIVAHIEPNGHKVLLNGDLANKRVYSLTTRTHIKAFAETFGVEMPY